MALKRKTLVILVILALVLSLCSLAISFFLVKMGAGSFKVKSPSFTNDFGQVELAVEKNPVSFEGRGN